MSKAQGNLPAPDPTPRPPARREARLSLPADPATDGPAAYMLHTGAIAGSVYASALAQRVSSFIVGCDFDASGSAFMEEFIRRMAPRDPAEELLIIQLALTHARVLHLTEYANRQERLETIRTVNEYADRASNTYRRLMLALAEYRRPPKRGDTFTAIRQANIAGQQIVNNSGNSGDGCATNEQGCGRREGGPGDRADALPPPLGDPATGHPHTE